MKLTRAVENTNSSKPENKINADPLTERCPSRRAQFFSPFTRLVCGALAAMAMLSSCQMPEYMYTVGHRETKSKTEEVASADVRAEADVYFNGKDARVEQKTLDITDELPKDVRDDPQPDHPDSQELDSAPETTDQTDGVDLQDVGTEVDAEVGPTDVPIEGFEVTDEVTPPDISDIEKEVIGDVEACAEPEPDIQVIDIPPDEKVIPDVQPDEFELTDEYIWPDLPIPDMIEDETGETEMIDALADECGEELVDSSTDEGIELDTGADEEVIPDVEPEVYIPPPCSLLYIDELEATGDQFHSGSLEDIIDCDPETFAGLYLNLMIGYQNGAFTKTTDVQIFKLFNNGDILSICYYMIAHVDQSADNASLNTASTLIEVLDGNTQLYKDSFSLSIKWKFEPPFKESKTDNPKCVIVTLPETEEITLHISNSASHSGTGWAANSEVRIIDIEYIPVL